MPEHKLISAAEVHTVYRKVFADEVARLADAGPYKAVELNIKAIQVDTAIEYRLTAITPTWTAVGAVGGGGINAGGFMPVPVQQNTEDGPQIAQGGSVNVANVGLDMTGIPAAECTVTIMLYIDSMWADGSVGFELHILKIGFDDTVQDPINRLGAVEETDVIGELSGPSILSSITDLIGAVGVMSFDFDDGLGFNGVVDFRFTASRGTFLEI